MIRSFPPPQYILVIRCVPVEIPTPKCYVRVHVNSLIQLMIRRGDYFGMQMPGGYLLSHIFIIHWSIYTQPLTIIFVAGI